MRENRTHGSEGGDGESRSRPLSPLKQISSRGSDTPKLAAGLVIKGEIFLYMRQTCGCPDSSFASSHFVVKRADHAEVIDLFGSHFALDFQRSALESDHLCHGDEDQ